MLREKELNTSRYLHLPVILGFSSPGVLPDTPIQEISFLLQMVSAVLCSKRSYPALIKNWTTSGFTSLILSYEGLDLLVLIVLEDRIPTVSRRC